MLYYLSLVIICVITQVHSGTVETGRVESSLQCNLCVDRFNWTNCDDTARAKECSVALVDATHNFLAQYSPELNKTGLGDRQFRCFRLELEIDVSSVNVFIRGCTYDDTTFCDGWTANGAKAINCAICSTGVCERNATWDVLPEAETTTTVGPSTAGSTTTSSPPAAIPFSCTECGSIKSWEDCKNNSRTVQCSAASVNKLHTDLQHANPYLPVGNYSEFKCFALKINFSEAEPGLEVQYGMGCTFAAARFCTRSEWRNATIMECSGASVINPANVISLTIAATLMMFVRQLKEKC